MKLYDVLLTKKKDELQELSKKIGLSKISRLKKPVLAEEVSKILLNKDLLETHLYLLSEKQYQLLRQILKTTTRINKENYKIFLHLNFEGFVYEENGFLLIPEDIKELLLSMFKSNYNQKYTIMHWIAECVIFAYDFYGIFSLSELKNLLKLNRRIKFNYDVTMIRQYLTDLQIDINQTTYYVSNAAYDFGIEELLREQEGKKIYIPTVEQISFYYENRFLLNQEYNVLMKELKKRFANDLIVESLIYSFFRSALYGEGTTATIDTLSHVIPFSDEQDAIFMISLFVQAYNNTNMMTNRGNTPLQTMKG